MENKTWTQNTGLKTIMPTPTAKLEIIKEPSLILWTRSIGERFPSIRVLQKHKEQHQKRKVNWRVLLCIFRHMAMNRKHLFTFVSLWAWWWLSRGIGFIFNDFQSVRIHCRFHPILWLKMKESIVWVINYIMIHYSSRTQLRAPSLLLLS